MICQARGQQADIGLGALNVIAGFIVAGLSKMSQRADADFLNQLVFAHAARNFGFQRVILILQPMPGMPDQQLAAYTGKHYSGLDRFDNVVGNASVKGAFFICVGILRGQENDRYIAGCFITANLMQHFVAGHFRHQHIQQDE